jgi:alkylhydroperoxidase family enzyme
MSWIRTIGAAEATGKLREIYEAAVKRAGKVFQILRVQSVNADVLEASLEVYKRVMFGPSPLSRRRREMLAVVTSRANDCHY